MTEASKIRILCSVTLLLLFARESVTLFFNKTSFIETKPLNITKSFHLTFRTCHGGNLLYQNGTNDDFFELSVSKGTMNYTTRKFTASTLNLRWKISGDRNVSSIQVGTQLDQNKPYSVVFKPAVGRRANLSVRLGNVVHTAQVPTTMYNVSPGDLTLGKGFLGCISFGDMFDVVNASRDEGTSENCTLNEGNRCKREACRPGYKGYYCEIDINECDSSPCHHAARCIDEIANYMCECGTSWYGRNCDNLKNKTHCDDKPCQNGGICHPVSDFNNYTCTCVAPYTGRNCTEKANPCSSVTCRNNANCTNIKGIDFGCVCLKGWAGKLCDIDIDDCVSVDCGHGNCVDGIASHSCNCTGSGYNGTDCNEDINECRADNPCRKNATCSNYPGGYQCTCVGDYEGKNCDQKIDDCKPDPCKNGGNCTDKVKDFKCVCPRGFAGRRCETELHSCKVNGCTACDDLPCTHGKCNCTCQNHSMYYNCSCDHGYHGVNCSQDINECVNGSLNSTICGDNGTCINTDGSFRCECSEGFTGKYCNETEGPCNPNPCRNGKCNRINDTVSGANSTKIVETYNCTCSTGWEGRNCTEDIDECHENIDNCNNSTSTCVNTNGTFKCRCFSGYGGDACTDINECKLPKQPCLHDGVCRNRNGSYACFCANGYSGTNCSNQVNECFDEDGKGKCVHGTCTDGIAEFTCHCNVGWSETLCNMDVDECKLGYCRNNATCNNTQGNYTCTCAAGFKDRNCSTNIDDCAGSPCLHNGTCTDKVNDYECACRQGYEGKSCEVDIDWCNVTRNNGSSPCDYGICEDHPLNYTCACFEGFTGVNCDIDEDECASSPCKNNATCVQKSDMTAVRMHLGQDRVFPKNESGGYLCACQSGYNGTNCENDINECLLYQACNKTFTNTCVDGINNYTCKCKPGYEGRNCSEDIDECSPSPCQNNGTCQNLIADYNCTCDSNHTGRNCEKLLDPCTILTPCRNGGTCTVISDFNYTCSCAEGFGGRLCTDMTTLGFDGTSSMAVDIPQTTNPNISFSFQTISPEGVLVSESKRWVLSLVSDILALICEDSTKCEIGRPGMFTDFNWHTIILLLDGSTVTARVGSDHNCSKACSSSRRRRNVASNTQLLVGADSGDSERPNFVGSIRDFSVNDVKYYPGVAGVSAEGITPGFQRQNVCSPDPCVNGVCRDLWTRYSCDCDRYWTSRNCSERVLWGTFGTINQLTNGYRPSGNQSYAMYSLPTTAFKNLVFTVRTKSKSSLILQLNFNNSKALSVESDNDGFLRVRRGSTIVNSQSSGGLKINDAYAHYIRINHSVIAVDNMTYDMTLTSFSVGRVFVGGLPRNGDEEASAPAQFRGCIRDVRLNGQQLLFFNQTADGLNSTQENIAVDCSREDVCGNIPGSNPCSNSGNCTDLWNEFECACPLPYGGDRCELYGCEWKNPCPGNASCINLNGSSEYECMTDVTFNESQSSAFFRNSTPLSSILNSVVIQFRTRQNNTVLLSSGHNTTYFELAVHDGHVRVMYNLDENLTGSLDTDAFVSNGSWHEVKLDSSASQTEFKISRLDLQQDKLTYLITSSSFTNSSVLNRSFTKLLSFSGVRIGSSSLNNTRDDLLGCLREVRLGKHLLTFSENSSADFSPEFRVARSAFTSAGLRNVRIGCHRNNVCTSSLCGFGTCVDTWNDFRCTCPVGFSGDRCEVTPCTASPCVNGTCTVRDSGFDCTCADNYFGTYCNETCLADVCKNGGKCGISGGKVTCTCEADWTGRFCETAVPRDDEEEDDLPMIIGLTVAGVVLLLLVIAVIFVCTRQTSSTFGTYSPSSEEKVGARVEMNPVLNVPPPEKLI